MVYQRNSKPQNFKLRILAKPKSTDNHIYKKTTFTAQKNNAYH